MHSMAVEEEQPDTGQQDGYDEEDEAGDDFEDEDEEGEEEELFPPEEVRGDAATPGAARLCCQVLSGRMKCMGSVL